MHRVNSRTSIKQGNRISCADIVAACKKEMHPNVKVTPYRVGVALNAVHGNQFYYSRKGGEKKTAFYYKLCLIEPPNNVPNILPKVLKNDMSTQCNLNSQLSFMQKEKEQLLHVISLESSSRLQKVSTKDLI